MPAEILGVAACRMHSPLGSRLGLKVAHVGQQFRALRVTARAVDARASRIFRGDHSIGGGFSPGNSSAPLDRQQYNLSSELSGDWQQGQLIFGEMKRRLLGLPNVGNQTGDEIDEKVGAAAVTGVFNLGDILALVNDGLDNETFACQQLVLERDESIAHVFAKRGDQLQSVRVELLKESLGEIPAVANQLTPQRFGHLWDWFAVNRHDFTQAQTRGWPPLTSQPDLPPKTGPSNMLELGRRKGERWPGGDIRRSR